MNAHPLEPMITEISPLLRKFAAHRSGTHYAEDLAVMAPEAQDLYQQAVLEILRTCKPTDSRSFLLNLANWRMLNIANRETYYAGLTIDEEGQEDFYAPISDYNLENSVITAERINAIRKAASQLKRTQAYFLCLLWDGASLSDIAARLGINYDTAWKRREAIRAAFKLAM